MTEETIETVILQIEYAKFEQFMQAQIFLIQEAEQILESEEYLDTAKDLNILRRSYESFLEQIYCNTEKSETHLRAFYAIIPGAKGHLPPGGLDNHGCYDSSDPSIKK